MWWGYLWNIEADMAYIQLKDNFGPKGILLLGDTYSGDYAKISNIRN